MKEYKFKHLTITQRNIIETSLNQNYSFKAIAQCIAKDPTTISKEIKKHRLKLNPTNRGIPINMCLLKRECTLKNICSSSCNNDCSYCFKCNDICKSFKVDLCAKLSKPPYVCNGCPSKQYCHKIKFYYRGLDSYREYISLLSSAREGISLTKQQLSDLDNLITPLIKNNKQSLAHIIANHFDDIPVSERTLFRYAHNDVLSVGLTDFHKIVKFKPRVKHKNTDYTEPTFSLGRTYNDFIIYVSENPHLPIVEMDLVEGSKGSGFILTLLFRNSNLMIGFKLESKKADNVIAAINLLESKIGKTRFKRYFPIILTDRGSEFKRPSSIELDSNSKVRTKLFYCDPQRSDQKAKIENNHRLLRYILPKGKSFKDVNQDDINMIMNHINNYSRKINNNNSPLQVALNQLPKQFVKALGFTLLNPDNVILAKSLIKAK